MINFHRICTHLSVWEGESGFRMGVTVEGEEANRGGQRIEGRVNGWERMLWCQTFIFKTTNYQNVPEIFSVSEHLIMNYQKSINSSHRQCLPSYKSDMFIIHEDYQLSWQINHLKTELIFVCFPHFFIESMK